MGYRYPAGAVRRLDDALLAVFGTRYLALHGNAHREAALRARLEKIRGGGQPQRRVAVTCRYSQAIAPLRRAWSPRSESSASREATRSGWSAIPRYAAMVGP